MTQMAMAVRPALQAKGGNAVPAPRMAGPRHGQLAGLSAQLNARARTMTQFAPKPAALPPFMQGPNAQPVLQGSFIGGLAKFLAFGALLFSSIRSGNAAFTGPQGAVVTSGLHPKQLGVEGSHYEQYWEQLRFSKTEIQVESSSRTGFIPASKGGQPKILINSQLLADLNKFGEDRRGGKLNKNGEKEADERNAIFADQLSILTHELAHAKDSVVLGQELRNERTGGPVTNQTVFRVITTELNAWAVEAGTIKELGHGNTALLNGWGNLTEPMMNNWDDVVKYAKKNEVLDRYRRYLARELNTEDPKKLGAWHTQYKSKVWKLMEEGKAKVAKRKKLKAPPGNKKAATGKKDEL